MAFQINVAPRMSNTVHTDGVGTLLAGLIIGFAAAWYLHRDDDDEGGR